MLQALLHKKLKASFADPTFRPSEDTLTSSVVGLMQYLPPYVFNKILKESCGINSPFPNDIGYVDYIGFWEHWDAVETSNARIVEPDVIICTNKYQIIIEAKKSDESGQYYEQWRNEIKAFLNTHELDNRNVVLLALGGNTTLEHNKVTINNFSCPIYKASWFNILNSVSKLINEPLPNHIKRILDDIVDAFEIHGFFNIEWLDSLETGSFDTNTIDVLSHNNSFSRFYKPSKPLLTKNKNIWQI